jgi:hypothetical protein
MPGSIHLKSETIHLRIRTIDEGPQIVADCPSWPAGAVPRVGEYIFHPNRLGEPQSDPHGIAGHVKTVTWHTHIRTEEGFVQNPEPFVEIYI